MSKTPLKVKCPSCQKEIKWEESLFRPFCSERCRLLDLGKWASEKYKVPGEKANPEEVESEKNKKEKD